MNDRIVGARLYFHRLYLKGGLRGFAFVKSSRRSFLYPWKKMKRCISPRRTRSASHARCCMPYHVSCIQQRASCEQTYSTRPYIYRHPIDTLGAPRLKAVHDNPGIEAKNRPVAILSTYQLWRSPLSTAPEDLTIRAPVICERLLHQHLFPASRSQPPPMLDESAGGGFPGGACMANSLKS
ncbi:hypothetical protein BC834DRAFT_699951 [Gloeopeniophorella convolvens]|nr:hypothetical protein BC834DRAFT_699951 [Gloeopeniophorella convolvens]